MRAAVEIKNLKEYREDEREAQASGDRAELAKALGGQGRIYLQRGDRDKALKRFQEQERIAREAGDQYGLAAALGGRAEALQDKDPDVALELYEDQARICRELDEGLMLARCLGKQSAIRFDRGDPGTAMELVLERERIYREIGDQEGLARSLGDQATIHRRAGGDPQRSLELYGESERIWRALGDQDGLADCLNEQSAAYWELGELHRAHELTLESKQLWGHQLGVLGGRRRRWVILAGAWMAIWLVVLVVNLVGGEIGLGAGALILIAPVSLFWLFRYLRQGRIPYYGLIKARDGQGGGFFDALRTAINRGLGILAVAFLFPIRDAVAEWRAAKDKGSGRRI